MADPKTEGTTTPVPKDEPKGVKAPRPDKSVPYEKSQMNPGRDGQVLTR